MDEEPLTPIQAKVLAAIRRRIEEGDPAPSYRELCKEFGWSSTGTVRDHLQALARKGCLELSGPGHRRIRLRLDRLAVSGVPLVGRVVAGSPVLAEENIERRIPVPAEWTRGGAYFALRVDGDSMVGAGIHEGDYVVVRQQEVADDGEIVVATLDGQTTLKRLERHGKRIVLWPENDRYQPIRVETESAAVRGVVVGLMRAYGSVHWSWHRVSSHPAVSRRRGAYRA